MIKNALLDLPDELEAEVCIAGAGPAGISLALDLADRGIHVLLLEGGGRDGPGEGLKLYDAAVEGRPYPVNGSRLRWLGGTSNHWGGWVKPLDSVDFLDKPHFPLPGWPFDGTELEPWYLKAAQWCEVPSNEYDPERAGLDKSTDVFKWNIGSGLKNNLFRFSPPTRFGRRYRERIENHEHLDCWLNLNLFRLNQDADSVRSIEARTLGGQHCKIRASYFVLAMGGLENPRMLLNQSAAPGNQSGLLGRCFMDHYGVRPGVLMAAEGIRYKRFEYAGHDLMPVVAPEPELVVSERLINSCFLFSSQAPDPFIPPEYWNSPVLRASGQETGALHYGIQMINEPLPHPQSRLELGDATDALGLKRTRLYWYLPEQDFALVNGLVEQFIQALGEQGLGRMQWSNREPVAGDQSPGVSFHHMGTTRMSQSPDHGVVNPDCRVWDRDNLYVAGSSVFPSAGYSNPTLTIVALAVRLAHHLAEQLTTS